MAKTNDVWVVIPNWNGARVIKDCLTSLARQSLNPQIIVVDNGSSDKSLEIIEKDFKDVHLVKLPKNRGFSGGVNVGIAYSIQHGASMIALFNNDAEADKNWLKSLFDFLVSNNKCGIVTGKLLRKNGQLIDSTGEQYSIWGIPFPRGRNQKDEGQFDKSESVFAASGGASLYRAEMLKDIGFFDEKFFAYLEDVDISFRARLAGWDVCYEPKAMATHEVGATSSKLGSFVRYHSIKNYWVLFTKNMPGKLYLKYLPLVFLQSLRLLVTSTLRGQLWAYIKAVFKFLIYLPSVLKERRRVQKARGVSVSFVDSLLYRHYPPKIPKI